MRLCPKQTDRSTQRISAMIKSSPLTCGLLLAFALATHLPAAPSPTERAEKEAVLRQETIIRLKQMITQAKSVEKDNDFATAAKMFEEAIVLVRKLGGVGVDSENAQALTGLNFCRLQLAQIAFRRGDFVEADAQLDKLLKLDPKSAAVCRARKRWRDCRRFKMKKPRLPPWCKTDDCYSRCADWTTQKRN